MLRDISVESVDAAIGAGSDARGAVGDELRDAAPPGLQPLLAEVVELRDFRRGDVTLSRADRRRIVDQALVLIEQNYVHLPHKAAMHAVESGAAAAPVAGPAGRPGRPDAAVGG